MITECLREGFSLANKNLQIVILRIAVTIINLFGFALFLGIPLIAAVVYLGMDLANIKDLLPFIMRSPFEFVSRYFGLVFFVGVGLIFSLLFSSLFFIYTLGGMLGVLKNSAINIQYRFSLSSFFKEANKNFSGLFWLISITFSLFILIAIAVIMFGGIITVIAQAFTGTATSMEVFFSSFVLISILVFSAIIFFAWFIFIVYSVVALVIEGSGAMESIKKTFVFLKNKPGAFLLYISLLFLIMLTNIILFVFKVSFGMVPGIAPFLGFFMAFFNLFFHSYIAVVMWSSLIVYYVKGVNYPTYSASYEI